MSTKILTLFRLTTCVLLALTINAACGLIYKQNVQQGNALEQKDLDELYLGMNKRQVSFVLGSPSVHDPFHQQRWDYVQTFSRRGGPMVQRTVTLRFDENDLLVEIIGADKTPEESDKTSRVASAAPEKAKELTSDADTATVKDVKKDPTEPEIKGLGERSAKDRDLKKEDGAGQQGSPDDGTSSD